MKLIVGLGNPGKQYEKTWHNLGFLAIDKIAENLTSSKFKEEKKFSALTSEGTLEKEKIILAKPTTFMNSSGQAVFALAKFYKIKIEDIIVVHDDIDLPLGKIRITVNSSAGGNNGVKSIIAFLKSQEFFRIKIGIATEELKKTDSADYVLEKIKTKNLKQVKESIDKASEAAICIVEKSASIAMNLFN
ncbi:MAG: aminoacyl-tRNA hydrolase [Candidatus Buchananbacteria bacterium]